MKALVLKLEIAFETIGYAVLLGLTGGALALAGKRKKTQLML